MNVRVEQEDKYSTAQVKSVPCPQPMLAPQLLSRQRPMNQFLVTPVDGQQLSDDFPQKANQSWRPAASPVAFHKLKCSIAMFLKLRNL
jgi:hypothetical protein